jgi:hypothetical protein
MSSRFTTTILQRVVAKLDMVRLGEEAEERSGVREKKGKEREGKERKKKLTVSASELSNRIHESFVQLGSPSQSRLWIRGAHFVGQS